MGKTEENLVHSPSESKRNSSRAANKIGDFAFRSYPRTSFLWRRIVMKGCYSRQRTSPEGGEATECLDVRDFGGGPFRGEGYLFSARLCLRRLSATRNLSGRRENVFCLKQVDQRSRLFLIRFLRWPSSSRPSMYRPTACAFLRLWAAFFRAGRASS